MYMSRFGVKNYKCLGEIDVPLTPIHVLIGENDAGKTSLLEAMAAMLSSSRKPLRDVFPEPWDGWTLVRSGSGRDLIEFSGTWTPSPGEPAPREPPEIRYRLAVQFGIQGKHCECHEECIENQQSSFGLHSGASGQTSSILSQREKCETFLPDEAAAIARKLFTLLTPARIYRLDPKVLSLPTSLDPERRFELDADGFGLARVLDEIAANFDESFTSIQKEFCGLFPQFRAIRRRTKEAVVRKYGQDGLYDIGRTPGKAIYLEATDGAKIDARQASDGALLLLGLLALVHAPNPPRILLIEEPENGIYPKRIEQAIQILKRFAEAEWPADTPQVVISTHSPYLLSFFEPEEVTFLSRPPDDPDGPVRARPLREAPNIKERLADGFYLGELWYNLSEEDLFGEP